MNSLRDSSSYRHRVRVGLFAILAFWISLYLGLYQLGIVHSVWEPFFGADSVRVLHSRLTSTLPIPDALLGALAYFSEIIILCIGDESRSVTRPWAVLIYLGIAAAIGVTGIGLILYQSFVIHHWCTLCLITGMISIALVYPAYREGKEAIAWMIGEHRAGIPWSKALKGNGKGHVKHAA